MVFQMLSSRFGSQRSASRTACSSLRNGESTFPPLPVPSLTPLPTRLSPSSPGPAGTSGKGPLLVRVKGRLSLPVCQKRVWCSPEPGWWVLPSFLRATLFHQQLDLFQCCDFSHISSRSLLNAKSQTGAHSHHRDLENISFINYRKHLINKQIK